MNDKYYDIYVCIHVYKTMSTFNWAKPAWNQYSFSISALREGPKVSALRKDGFFFFTSKISFHSISRKERPSNAFNFPM